MDQICLPKDLKCATFGCSPLARLYSRASGEHFGATIRKNSKKTKKGSIPCLFFASSWSLLSIDFLAVSRCRVKDAFFSLFGNPCRVKDALFSVFGNLIGLKVVYY